MLFEPLDAMYSAFKLCWESECLIVQSRALIFTFSEAKLVCFLSCSAVGYCCIHYTVILHRAYRKITRAAVLIGVTVFTVCLQYEHIFRRMHPPPVPKEGEEGWRLYDKEPDGVPGVTHSRVSWAHVWDDDYHKFKKDGDEFVYIEEKNTDDDLVGEIEVILCWDIDGLGMTGDKVRVNRDLARHQLITLGGAVYVTPENVEKYAKIAEENARKRESGEDMSVPDDYDRIMKMLEAISLPIPMNLEAEWTLNKTHVRVALRRQGLWIPEENIDLPDEITSESNRDLEIYVTLRTRGGSIYRTIPVNAQIVDKSSPLARAKPFAQTFQYRKKTITEVILSKYKEINAEKFAKRQAQEGT